MRLTSIHLPINYNCNNSTKTATRGERCLDLILINAPPCYVSETWPELGNSDHKTVVSTPRANSYKELLPETEIKLVRSGKIEDTVADLRAINWSHIISKLKKDPQEATNDFYHTLKTAEDENQPLKVLKTKGDKPWMTLKIKKLIQKRQRCFKSGCKNRWKSMSQTIKREIAARKRTTTSVTQPHRTTIDQSL